VDGLRSVTVILTAACNLRCAYCFQDRKQPRRMDWETLRRAVDLLLGSRRSDLRLWFSGGEPLLEFPQLRRAVRYAEATCPPAKSVRFGLSTNGLLLDDDRADFLAAHRFDLQVSFDGLSPAQDLRAAGSFRVLDARLGRLRRSHPTFFTQGLEVAMILTGANLAVLADSVEYFLEKGVRTVTIAPRATPDPDWSERSFVELRRQLGRVFEASLRFYRRTGRVPVTLFRRTRDDPERKRASPWLCGLARGQALTVDVDGRVAGCVMLAESYQTFPTRLLRERVEALRIGDLHDPGLPGRLAAFPAAVKATRLFDGRSRKHSSFGRCRQCRYRRGCSICPVSIVRVPGNTDLDRVPDVLCAFNRVALDYRSQFPRQASTLNVLTGHSHRGVSGRASPPSEGEAGRV
jgi:sulfatase maturation enzyme AslB (radical SAM superfamily)